MDRCPFCSCRPVHPLGSSVTLAEPAGFRWWGGGPGSVPPISGWTSCPVPCLRLLRGDRRGEWVLFQLPSGPEGVPGPRGRRLVHSGPEIPSMWTGRRWGGLRVRPGPGQLWWAGPVPDDYCSEPDVLMEGDCGMVGQGTFRRAVRELVLEAPVAEVMGT